MIADTASIITLLAAQLATTPPPARPPAAESNLVLDGPITRWDEAIPLGNGLLGGLLWGGDVDADGALTLNLSLDRGDLWDLRLPDTLKRDDWTWQTIQQLHAAGDDARVRELFDVPYDTVPYPTKLPGGRLTMTWPHSRAEDGIKEFSLDLATATGRAVNARGTLLSAFFCATEHVAMLRCDSPPTLAIMRPSGLDRLEYAPAEFAQSNDDGSIQITSMTQQAALGLRYAIVVGWRTRDHHTEIAVSVTSTADGDDPEAIGRSRIISALDRGYDVLHEEHTNWWRRFWLHSRISIPDARLQKHYDFVKYLYGSGSRDGGAPPMPLQGVWTADEGGLPPWKGDFHNDLNTQMTYLAYPTAGLYECGESFLDFNWKLLPKFFPWLS